MRGEELYDSIELEINANPFSIPTSVEIPTDSYKSLWKHIDEKKLNGREFGIFLVADVEIYCIPVKECFEVVEKDENKTKKQLPFKLIFEGKQGELKSNHPK